MGMVYMSDMEKKIRNLLATNEIQKLNKYMEKQEKNDGRTLTIFTRDAIMVEIFSLGLMAIAN
jgi:adenine C2-methylase RlmN of 23S rRNA A2503 and tRNA A37